MAKHQRHYASLEEVIKNITDKQFPTVTTHKTVQTITMKSVHIM